MTARAGMADILLQLRAATNAGSADTTVNGVAYWTDDQLQAELDRYQTYWRTQQLEALPVTSTGGTLQYFDFLIPEKLGKHIEQNQTGSGWVIRDSMWNSVGTAQYSVNYDARRITFGSDTRGTAYYLDARSYDLNQTAASVWKRKASMAYQDVDWSSDNHTIKASQEYQHCLDMAAYFESQAGVQVGYFIREDENF